MNRTQIATTRVIYPQIYAYILPTVSDKDGWVKIGYTERPDVNTRIKEQVGTVDLDYQLLWYEVARFINSQFFNDHQFDLCCQQRRKTFGRFHQAA